MSVDHATLVGAHEAAAPGDFNNNGTVDAADYTIWRDTQGSTTDLRADGNGDRQVNEFDYAIWKSLFGTAYNDGPGVGATVPEPTSALYLAVAGMGWCVVARRRSSRPR